MKKEKSYYQKRCAADPSYRTIVAFKQRLRYHTNEEYRSKQIEKMKAYNQKRKESKKEYTFIPAW